MNAGSGEMTPNLHVLMFLTRPMDFSDAWALAAARSAQVTTIERVDELSGPALDKAGTLGLRRDAENAFELRAAPFLRTNPSVLFRPLFHQLQVQSILKALPVIEQRRGKVDVLHTHFFTLWALSQVSRASRIPLVHTEHSSSLAPEAEQPVASKRVSRLGLRMARQVFQGAARVLPVSRYLARCISGRGLGGNLEPVPNPIDVTRFRALPLPRVDDDVRILSVGRLAPEKNQAQLVRAMSHAVQINPRLRLCLVGRGPLEAELRSLTAQLGLADVVEFRGFVPNLELPALLHSSHLFATTTRMETFGVAVAEALAAGRPVVAPRVAALPELVTSPALGQLAEADDDMAFARALLEVAGRLDGFSPDVFTKHAEGFSSEAVGRALATVYRDCSTRLSGQALPNMSSPSLHREPA